jgi:molybdenum cofactor biosynthesis enzyme MoaA
MDLGQVLQRLEESKKLGVKEYYFTGGEPFIHPHIVEIVEATLAIGPATVLTNATLLKPKQVERLATIERGSLYSLELRVSLDGYSPEMNDAIRGKGAFGKAIEGVKLLLKHGFLPIVTVAQTWDERANDAVAARFVEVLKAEGYSRPRIKMIPTLHIGEEETRTRGYDVAERLTAEMMEGFDASQLLCTRSRMVTGKGIFVCPILIESPGARLGTNLGDSLEPVSLDHGACTTCYREGAICSNLSSGGADVS